MIFSVCLLSILLVILLREQGKRLRKKGETSSLRYLFIARSLEFLIPLGIVAAVFLLLKFFIGGPCELLPLSSLVRFEQSMERVGALVESLQPQPMQILVILALLYLLRLGKLMPALRRVSALGRHLYVIVVLLCSFTLLGTQLGPPTEELKFRIKFSREGYGTVHAAVHEEVVARTGLEFLDQTLAALSEEFRGALGSAQAAQPKTQELRAIYTRAESEFGIRLRQVDRVLARQTAREESATKSMRLLVQLREHPASVTGEVPEELNRLSNRKIRRALRELASYRATNQPASGETIELATLVSYLPKVLTSKLREECFETLRSYSPVYALPFEIVASALEGKLDNVLKLVVKRGSLAVFEGAGVEETAEAESRKILQKWRISVPERLVAESTRRARAAAVEQAEIVSATETVTADLKRREAKRIDRWIVQLSSDVETRREEAVTRLAEAGPRLNERHIQRLMRVMRSGKASFSRFLYRESHCEWFEDTTVRYYAGKALKALEHPKLTQDVRAEANRAIESGQSRYRVTDPGWI